jgi:hypothetical protein
MVSLAFVNLIHERRVRPPGKRDSCGTRMPLAACRVHTPVDVVGRRMRRSHQGLRMEDPTAGRERDRPGHSPAQTEATELLHGRCWIWRCLTHLPMIVAEPFCDPCAAPVAKPRGGCLA